MIKISIAFLFCTPAILAQDPAGDRVTVPLSRPGQPATIQASLLKGSITVHGYDGKDVVVEAKANSNAGRPERLPKKAEGLRRIDAAGTGLRVEEADNVISIGAAHNSDGSIVVQTPVNTSLKLSALHGEIVVERISGEVAAKSTNGGITIRNVSGAVTANTLNGDLIVVFERVAEGKPMAFSSFNGDVDVTLPGAVKANIKAKAGRGDLYSDFDVKLEPARKPTTESAAGKGKYKIVFDRTVTGSINGGGPELQFTTFNGEIFIRRAK
jgi:DUF4097 and DUF4098 domain-containing protein YvlB